MPISGTNQNKNNVNPVGGRKAGIYLWGDVLATWGDTLATWGNYAISVVNQTKSQVPIQLQLQDGNFFLLQDGDYWELQGGVVATTFINQSKS